MYLWALHSQVLFNQTLKQQQVSGPFKGDRGRRSLGMTQIN